MSIISPIETTCPFPLSIRPRANTLPSEKPSPTSGSSPPRYDPSYLPFTFGVEFELILRRKAVGIETPSFNDPQSQIRRFHWALCEYTAALLTAHSMPCSAYDPAVGESPVEYSRWNVMQDASLSKSHRSDWFFEVEIVSPKTRAERSWVEIIDNFWSVLLANFDLRQDASCGFHIHVSTATDGYTHEQLRMMPKAVVFWEPSTAKCAPLSRQNEVQDFCKSNIAGTMVGQVLEYYGLVQGLQLAFEHIDRAGINEIVRYVCPDKYRAWNFLPCKTGGTGSIEFRRPPGVVTAKKTKHWIAFTMAFVDMAVQFDPSVLPSLVYTRMDLGRLYDPAFESRLVRHARALGLLWQLDPRLRQVDAPRDLRLTRMSDGPRDWLRQRDSEYE